MKVRLLLALLPAVWICLPANLIHAQQNPLTTVKPAATGRISGVLKDPSGAVVTGAKIEIRSIVPGFKRSQESDQQGHFEFSQVPVGRYQVTISAGGFDIAVLPDLAVTAGTETAANVALKIAPAKAFVEVNGSAVTTIAATRHTVDASDEARSRNAAELVGNAPGVSLRENGQLASIPFLHGLGDERTKLVVDGMTVSSACPNHMNPPLSYIAPSDAAQITVLAGITPVSLGGDSLGGTVAVDSRQPVFAGAGERLHEEGSAYRLLSQQRPELWRRAVGVGRRP